MKENAENVGVDYQSSLMNTDVCHKFEVHFNGFFSFDSDAFSF